MEASERTQDGTGTGRERDRGWRSVDEHGNKSSSGDGNGDGNEDGIGEGGGEAKKRKKPHKSCRCDVANVGDFGG